ncbi:RNA-directed DNA polymerase, eukaryota, reverse transcriptase zinc-binding domain protein [Tanacetum coccineum]
MKELQINIDKAPALKQLREEEGIVLQEYDATMKDEEKILYKKAKLKWLTKANKMVKDVSDDEIKEAMFLIDGIKAPGPDGFSSLFFKTAWNIVGEDVCKSVKEFFVIRKLLSKINSTMITLVPKIQSPDKVTDFRPIACCNVLYKYISKIITKRKKKFLGNLVDKNQSAFVPNRHIQDNI